MFSPVPTVRRVLAEAFHATREEFRDAVVRHREAFRTMQARLERVRAVAMNRPSLAERLDGLGFDEGMEAAIQLLDQHDAENDDDDTQSWVRDVAAFRQREDEQSNGNCAAVA